MVKKMLYDVDVLQLQKLDTFVDNPAALDAALGNKLDAQDDTGRFINAARALFGRQVEETLWLLREGQPGYRYAQRFQQMVTMYHHNRSEHDPGLHHNDSPHLRHPDLTEETRVVRPQQQL